MTFDRSKRTSGDINITPLIDMVFLLIIFFLLTSSFIRDTGIPITLPDAASAMVRETEDITVVVTADGQIFLEDLPVKPEMLEAMLKDAYSRKKISTVTVKSDKEASVGILVEVIDIVNLSGADSLTLSADRKPR